jgi:AraC family transcriptional regulator
MTMAPSTQRDYHERMLRVLVHIQHHLDDALCLEDLAAVANFSPYHFHRIFRGMVGESVMEHIRRLRLERAAQQLKVGDMQVTRIAFDAGYETHEAFTRAFGRLLGVSPSEFRAQHRPLPLAANAIHFVTDGELTTFEPIGQGDVQMEVAVKKLEPMRVAFVRHVGPYQAVGETWNKLCGWAGPRGLFGPHSKMLGLCHDDPDVTPPDKLRYDACITVGPQVEAEGEVGVQEIPAGEYAMTLHAGPYEKLNETYAAMCGQWLPQSGRELRSDPSLEMYLNSPNDTKPEDLRTEVYVPLK